MKKDCDKVRCFRCNGTGHKQYECFAGRDYPRQASMRPTRTLDRQGGYDRSNYQIKKPLQRRINTVGEDENVYTRTGDDDWNQRREERRMETEEGYPKEEALFEAELIGALNRI